MTPAVEELAKSIQERREELFQACALVELCTFACTSHYDGGMPFENALAAFDLLYKLIDHVAGELGMLIERLGGRP
jgi:hypothetical protein